MLPSQQPTQTYQGINGSTIVNSPFSGNYTQGQSSNTCGLSFSTGVNSNSSTTTTWDARITYSTNPCPNQEKLEKIRQEAETKRASLVQNGETKRKAIETQSRLLELCITKRSEAFTGKPNIALIDLDKICTIPDLSKTLIIDPSTLP